MLTVLTMVFCRSPGLYWHCVYD